MSDNKWEAAIVRAKYKLGYSQNEYISDWETLMSQAKDEYKKMYERWKKEYIKYLKTDRWLELREKVFLRDSFKCVDCGGKSECVHHLSYDNLYGEFEKEDCISLCNFCHMERHNLKAGENENNIFIGKCYMCSCKKPIFRMDSWKSKKLDDGYFIMGSWRNFCKECCDDWGWDYNREYNKCVDCFDLFLGRKNGARCKNCRSFYL